MDDTAFMRAALSEALAAADEGEIPVGAVVVKDGQIIGSGHNRRLRDASPFAHAEMAAMAQAAQKLKRWRFDECVLYVTLEPCAMCAGAIVQCRVGRLVYGAPDPKAGAAGSLYDIPGDSRICHRCEVRRGVLEQQCAKLLGDFFLAKRKARSNRPDST